MPSITLTQLDIDPEVLRLVPGPLAEKLEVLPIKRSGNTLTLAMADPTNVLALDDVAFMTNLQIQPVVASEVAIRKAIDRLYNTPGESVADMMSELEEAEADVEVLEGADEFVAKADVFELKESADEAPVVRLMNMILVDAIRRARPTSTSSPTRRCSGSASASTACSTRSWGRRSGSRRRSRRG